MSIQHHGTDIGEVAVGLLRKAEERWAAALRRELEDQEAIGGYLASVREERGVSMCRHARAMGISQPYLSLLEHGKRPWTEDLVGRWIAALEKAAS